MPTVYTVPHLQTIIHSGLQLRLIIQCQDASLIQQMIPMHKAGTTPTFTLNVTNT